MVRCGTQFGPWSRSFKSPEIKSGDLLLFFTLVSLGNELVNVMFVLLDL